jgi:hypothetical protein
MRGIDGGMCVILNQNTKEGKTNRRKIIHTLHLQRRNMQNTSIKRA